MDNRTDIGTFIRTARTSRGLSQKQVALAAKMDTSNYSKIEAGNGDPSFSSILKISKAIGISLSELFRTNEGVREVRSADKSLNEKVALIEQLDKKEKAAFYAVLDAFISKKKLKDALNDALQNAK